MFPTYVQLTGVVDQTGLWDGGRRNGPHSFRLSPEPYRITQPDKLQLDALAQAVHRALLGISRLLAIAADSSLRDGSATYVELYRLLTRGSPYNLFAHRPSSIPLMCKADLMVDQNGHFWIAELDATNPRSWGYSVLGRMLCEAADPGAKCFPGVVQYLANHLLRSRTREVLFLYGHTQRFYEPEFQILARSLRPEGIIMQIRDETQIDGGDLPVAPSQTGARWLVDMPPMSQNKALIEAIRHGALTRSVEFIIPPKHPLSSKALLAVLADHDGRFEHLLRSQISREDLDLIRLHLPPTFIVGKGYVVPAVIDMGRVVLKKSVASGMKGAWLSDDPSFAAALASARQQNASHVVQCEINQRCHRWQAYDPDQTLTHHDDWRVRLTGYFSRQGCQDLAVTARRDRRVHGATDAIITGTVIT